MFERVKATAEREKAQEYALLVLILGLVQILPNR
jgi:hypothetical protein